MGRRALDHGDIDARLVEGGADVMGRIVGADHNDFFARVTVWPRMLRGMMLLAQKAVPAVKVGNIRLAGHARCKYQLLGPEHDLLAIAIDDDRPFLRSFIPFCRFGGGAGPIVQLHDLGVEFQPVADLVFRRKDRPVLREIDIGQVVVPDGVVQAE